MRVALTKLLVGRDLTHTSVKGIRHEMAVAFGLPPDSFDHKKDEIQELCRQIIAVVCERKSVPHLKAHPLGSERIQASRRVYLVTMSHPEKTHSADGVPLRKPGEFSRADIRDMFLQICENLQENKFDAFRFLLLSVWRELHGTGEPHYHVALLGCRQFRFNPYKKAVLSQYGLSSHWSVSHDNYASAFSYCHWPSAGGKSTQELDPTPLLWPTSGDNQHPPPEQARKGPVTAGASAELKEAANKRRAEAGKPEQRFRDIDLWPVVVNEGIRPGRDAVEKVVAYGKRCGGLAMSQWCFDNEQKIKELVSRAWRFEGAEESVERLGKSRMKILNEAASSSCVCGGRWAAAARELFFLNDLDLNRWSAAVRYSFENGRQTKGSLVCHAGLEGNEGCHLVE